MVGSCNGLRLADSALTSDFNLGLSFVDGAGVAYVSSLFCNLGSNPCIDLFSAAMASGYALGEAVLLTNIFLLAAGVEHPAFWAIGIPNFRLGLSRTIDVPTLETPEAELEMDFKGYLGEILLAGRAAFMAREGRFSVAATAVRGDHRIHWFHRLEEGEGGSYVRLIFFSYPGTLGRIRWSVVDRTGLEARCLTALCGLSMWREFFALSGHAADAAEVRNAIEELEPMIVESLNRAGYDAVTLQVVVRQTYLLERLGRDARDRAVGWLSTELMKSFWLTNLYVGGYRTESIGMANCQNCGAAAVRRILCNPVAETRRESVVCPRCGIVHDSSIGGTIKLAIVAPLLFPRGRGVEAELSITCGVGETVLACLRLSANSWCDQLPEPAFVEVPLGEVAGAPIPHTFTLPDNLPPHRYFLKAVAASHSELAFASRVIYVV